MAKNNISNQIKNNVGALNSQVGMARQKMQHPTNNANNRVTDMIDPIGGVFH